MGRKREAPPILEAYLSHVDRESFVLIMVIFYLPSINLLQLSVALNECEPHLLGQNVWTENFVCGLSLPTSELWGTSD